MQLIFCRSGRNRNMARADLLKKLFSSYTNNDRELFLKIAQEIIADERKKKHTLLADELERMMECPLKQSICCRNVFTTRLISPCSEASLLLRPMASNSSNRIKKLSLAAISNTRRILLAVSPRYEDTKASNLTYIKGIPISAASTFAHNVFPQPGGP